MLVALLLKYGPKLAVGVAILAALFFAYRWAYGRGVASVQPALQQAKMTAQQAVDANTANVAAIATLKAANAACVAAQAANQAQADGLAAQLSVAQQQATQAVKSRTVKVEKVYATDPNAQAWRDTRVPDGLLAAIGLQ